MAAIKPRYRKVAVRIHNDDHFRALSSPKANAQTLFFYLLTAPETNALPGLLRLGEAQLAEHHRWSIEATRKCLSEIIGFGMMDFDAINRVMWLPNAIRYNEPESPNVVRAWAKAADEIPDCQLKWSALMEMKQWCDAKGEGFSRAFRDVFIESFPQAFSVQEIENKGREAESLNARPRESLPESLSLISSSSSSSKKETPLPPKGDLPPKAAPNEAWVLQTWNAAVEPPVRRAEAISGSRARAAKARLAEPGFRDAWPAICQRINASPFCRGVNDRGWTAGIDFALRAGVWQRVIEGEFDAATPKNVDAFDRAWKNAK